MAIALTCPACQRALKVKDELAGRKIKCPDCAAVIAVPGKKAVTETGVTATKPRPIRPPRLKRMNQRKKNVPGRRKRKRPPATADC